MTQRMKVSSAGLPLHSAWIRAARDDDRPREKPDSSGIAALQYALISRGPSHAEQLLDFRQFHKPICRLRRIAVCGFANMQLHLFSSDDTPDLARALSPESL